MPWRGRNVSAKSETQRLVVDIEKLDPIEKIELAAGLLENKRGKTALLILRKVVLELETLNIAGLL